MKPLAGLRVLDFTHVLAGPFATRILGDMGADVVKVLSAARAVGANMPDHPYYIMWNRNKRALALDMTREEARRMAADLCDTADVVIDNFSVGVLDRWGIGYEEVSGRQPGVIYAQMSGMGEGGPWSDFVTYAPTIHALAGLTYLTGVPGRRDLGIGFSYNDHLSGLHGCLAILAALEARRRTGRGQRIEVSQFEIGVNTAGPSLLDYFANGTRAEPTGNRHPYDEAAPHNIYRCAPREVRAVEDEKWLAIACMTDDHWRRLKEVMGNPAWAADSQLDQAAGRRASAILDEQIGAWTADRDAAELMALCQAAGVPAGVVQNGIDLAESDPQLRLSGFLQPIADAHPVLGPTWADALPLHFSATPCRDYRRVRRVGEDNESVLRDWLGMDADEVAKGEEDGFLR